MQRNPAVPCIGSGLFDRLLACTAMLTLLLLAACGGGSSGSATPPVLSISGVSPASGATGVAVTLTGHRFTGATAVAYNGTADTTFSVVDDSTIQSTVPAGASSGSITVTTAEGSARSARFVVGALATYTGVASGIGNVDGSGSAALFYGPSSSTLDSAGNIYVVDRYNHTIRRITSAGVVTTLAGTPGVTGHTDGPGASALFNGPTGIAADNRVSGKTLLYVADRSNNLIRTITVVGGTGTVTTLAGSTSAGLANGTTAATFNHPAGVAVASDGTVYVADEYNSTIRKIDTGTLPATVSTVAGVPGTAGHADTPGSATFNGPQALAVDASGNIYVADTGNHTIRLVTAAGVVSTYAGLYNAGQPGSAEGYPGAFNTPSGIALDLNGTVFVADSGNQAVRTITPLGIGSHPYVTTLAGHTINSGYGDGIGLGSYFDFPTGVVLDATGTTLVVSDKQNNAIRLVPTTPATGLQSIDSGSVPNGAGAAPVSTSRASTLAGFAVWQGSGLINNPSGLTGTAFSHPGGPALDAAGNLYVADNSNHVVRIIAAGGTSVSTFAGTGVKAAPADPSTLASATFDSPNAIAVSTNPASATFGNIYVADTGNNAIRQITSTGTVTTIGGTVTYNTPLGIAVDLAGNVYVADTNDNLIRRIAPDGAVTSYGTGLASPVRNGAAASATFNRPYGVAVDNSSLATSGTIYVADTSNHLIRKIAGGAVSTLAGTGLPGSSDGTGTGASFSSPYNLAVDNATGDVYVADTHNQTIRRITPAGVVTTLVGTAGLGRITPGPLPATLAFPWGLTVDPTLGSLVICVDHALLTAPF